MSIVSYLKGNYRWPYFHNAIKIISETLCVNWERQFAKSEVLDVLRRSVCDITKCNVIEITICFNTVNSVIRIKIEYVFGMIRKNRRLHRLITTTLAVNIFVCSEKIFVYPGALETIQIERLLSCLRNIVQTQ